MTAIKEAFKKANKIPADERLYDVAKDILTQKTSFDGKVKSLLDAVCADAELLWELFESFRDKAARQFLTEVSEEERKQQKSANGAPSGSGLKGADYQDGNSRSASISQMPGQTGRDGGGQIGVGNQFRNASSVPNNGARQPVAQPSGSGHPFIDNQARDARPAFGKLTNGGNASAKVTRRIPEPGEGLRPVTKVAEASLLETFKVKGVAIGEQTPEDVYIWSANSKRDGRFVELIIAGVPWNKPIKDYVKPEEARKLMDQATRETQNAT